MPSRKAHPSNRTDDTLFGVDDGSFQETEIRWQRAGRAVLALFVVGGFLGVFGSGPLSDAKIRSEDGSTELRFERWTRAHATTEFRVRTSGIADSGALRLWIDKSFADAIEIQQILPEVERSSSRPERVEFQILAPHDSVVEVVVRYQPLDIGFKTATIGLGHAAPMRIRQVVFP